MPLITYFFVKLFDDHLNQMRVYAIIFYGISVTKGNFMIVININKAHNSSYNYINGNPYCSSHFKRLALWLLSLLI